MSGKKYISDVTLCMTMGGRPDLLRQSLQSISNKYEFPHVIAVNDFNDPRCDEVFFEFFPMGALISDGVKRGHHGAVNELYENVRTKYIFHTEDDWVFDKDIDFDKVKIFLEKEKNITSFCFRDIYSFLGESELSKIKSSLSNDVSFFDLSKVHDEWYFYTFNPHLIKRETVELLGDYRAYKKERHISRFFKKQEMFVAYSNPGICVHIGDGASVANPNAVKKKSRLRIWIRQKINKLK